MLIHRIAIVGFRSEIIYRWVLLFVRFFGVYTFIMHAFILIYSSHIAGKRAFQFEVAMADLAIGVVVFIVQRNIVFIGTYRYHHLCGYA